MMTVSGTNRHKRFGGFSNFGFSTILLSFVMICVVTFSALSLVSAYSDHKLSQKVADRTTAYYAAEERAYEKLARIDDILRESYLATDGKAAYYALAETLLAKANVTHEALGIWSQEQGQYTLSYTETIAEGQTLSVKIAIYYPTKGTNNFYGLLEWRSIYEQKFPEDDHLDVMQ